MATNLLNRASPSRPATGTIRVAVASGDGVRELDGATALEALPTLCREPGASVWVDLVTPTAEQAQVTAITLGIAATATFVLRRSDWI